MGQRIARSLWIVMLGIAVGCGGDGKAALTGHVTFDHQPLASGAIVFLPENGEGASCGDKIADGRYAVRLTPGKKAVKITANRFVEKQERRKGHPEDGYFDVQIQYIPAQYNTATTLAITVPAENGTADFDLTK
jgi:hypothetical protein